MHRFRPRRPSTPTAISLLALFVALGGTSYAAISISGQDLRNGTVTGNKLANGSINYSKIKPKGLYASLIYPGSMTSTQIRKGKLLGESFAANTITGDQIDESKLGVVPSADNANGVKPTRIAFKQSTGANNQAATIYTGGGLTLLAVCDNAGKPLVTAKTATNDADFRVIRTKAGGATVESAGTPNFDTATGFDVFSATDDSGVATFVYSQNDGTSVSGTLAASSAPSYGGTLQGCAVTGHALQ
jgi:hypothetical protein